MSTRGMGQWGENDPATCYNWRHPPASAELDLTRLSQGRPTVTTQM